MKSLQRSPHERRHGRLPDLIIAGFQKCATSATYQILSRHPMIAGATRWSPHATRFAPKELHFFSDERNYARGLPWYASHFEQESARCMEATPEYITSELALRRMAEALPDAKIVVMLRDPVKRAYSAWNHWTQLPPERRWRVFDPEAGFRENLELEFEALKKKPFYYRFLGRGFYIDQIERLEAYYPRERVFFGFAERLKQGQGEIERLQRFIGVPVMDLPNRMHHSRSYGIAPLDEATASFLRSVYEPYDDRLAEHLGVALPWREPEPSPADQAPDSRDAPYVVNPRHRRLIDLEAGIFPKPDLAPPELMESAIRDPAMHPRADDRDAPLAVITVYWNFPGFRRPASNLLRFLRDLDCQGIPVYGMELHLRGAPSLMRANPRWLCLEIGEENILWQKEAMFNRIAREVPPDIPCIAAMDCDIRFERPDWARRSVEALASTPAVQPFTLAVWTDECGRAKMTRSCSARDGLSAAWHTHPGFAWVYRREFFDGPGYYPWCVVGGGDTANADALLDPDLFPSTERAVGTVNLRNGLYGRWAAEVQAFMGGERPGWVEGQVWHEWHGDWRSRQYVDRHKGVMETFDATLHTRLAPSGLLEWTDEAPERYREKLRNYFDNRKEDGAR